MFILFVLLVLVNSLADNDKVILEYRYEVAGLPINMLDFGLAVMFVAALATMNRPKQHTDRTHPLLYWTIGFLSASVVCGIFGAFRNNVELRYWVTIMRNVMTLPLCIFLGYHLIRTPRHAKWATYVMILGSIGSGIFVLLFVRESGEALKTFDMLRSTTHGGDAGLYAMAFLAFAVIARAQFLPTWLSLALIPFSALCFFSLPHRSSWVTGAATMAFAVWLLPHVKFGRKAVFAFGLGALLSVSIVMAISAYSQLTGKDFGGYIENRLRSLLPGEDEYAGIADRKAWATRLPGVVREFELWIKSPLTGQGFGIQTQEEVGRMSEGAGSFRHNVWSASLAESGIFGLLGYMVPPITAMFIGFRLVRQAPDRGTLYLGALGAVVGCAAFFYSFMTLSINTQRIAIPLGLVCGMVYRCRAMQLTVAREYAGYVDSPEELSMILDDANLAGGYAPGVGYSDVQQPI
jgi:O-Antigen ligase